MKWQMALFWKNFINFHHQVVTAKNNSNSASLEIFGQFLNLKWQLELFHVKIKKLKQKCSFPFLTVSSWFSTSKNIKWYQIFIKFPYHHIPSLKTTWRYQHKETHRMLLLYEMELNVTNNSCKVQGGSWETQK